MHIKWCVSVSLWVLHLWHGTLFWLCCTARWVFYKHTDFAGGFIITIVLCLWPWLVSPGRLKDNQIAPESRLLLFNNVLTITLVLYIVISYILCREGFNFSYNGLWCKGLRCFYKIDINARDSILELHWERCHPPNCLCPLNLPLSFYVLY